VGKYYFQTQSPDLAAIAKRLVVWFKQHEYDVDVSQDDKDHFIQAKKTGSLRTLTGTNIAFKITLSPSDTADEFICDMATGKWAANLTGAGMTALFTGGATLLTGAMGAAWTYKVERDIVEFMETTLKFRKMRTESDGLAAVEASPISSPPPLPASRQSAPSLSPAEQARSQVQAEIRKLEDAHGAGILSDEELAAKKKDVFAKEAEYEIRIIVSEQTDKLKQALVDGILDSEECAKKIAAIEGAVRANMASDRMAKDKAERIAKLQAARDAGILSLEEYTTKVAALG
jgi:hypothetical protein